MIPRKFIATPCESRKEGLYNNFWMITADKGQEIDHNKGQIRLTCHTEIAGDVDRIKRILAEAKKDYLRDKYAKVRFDIATRTTKALKDYFDAKKTTTRDAKLNYHSL